MNEDKALENKNEDTLIEEQHSDNLPSNRRKEAENDTDHPVSGENTRFILREEQRVDRRLILDGLWLQG